MKVLKEKYPEVNELEVRYSAETALLTYAETAPERRGEMEFIGHAMRTRSLAESFRGKVFPGFITSVALLHDIAERFDDNNEKYQRALEQAYALEQARALKQARALERAAKEPLLGFLTDPALSRGEAINSLRLMVKLTQVEKASGGHRKRIAKEAKLNGSVVSDRVSKMIKERYAGEIPPIIWEVAEPSIDFSKIRSAVEELGIGSIFIKACELVDNIRYPSSLRKSALLQDVLEAESFVAPILETKGFDGLASLLRSEAQIARITEQGMGNLVDQARNEIKRIEEIGVEAIAGSVFGDWLGGESKAISAITVDEMTGRLPVHMGDIVVDGQDSRRVRVKYRIKTVGSLARKYLEKGDKGIMDLVGMTVVSKDAISSAEDFASFVADRLLKESRLKLQKTPSKDRAVYIQGPRAYIDIVKSRLKNKGVELSDCQFDVLEDEDQRNKKGYRALKVAKVTFLAEDNVPTEVQFLSEEERAATRIGEVAHVIYKYLKQLGSNMSVRERRRAVDEAVGVLEYIHSMKSDLDQDDPVIDAATGQLMERFALRLAA